jgi:H+/gluconate symporter-like permease
MKKNESLQIVSRPLSVFATAIYCRSWPLKEKRQERKKKKKKKRKKKKKEKKKKKREDFFLITITVPTLFTIRNTVDP